MLPVGFFLFLTSFLTRAIWNESSIHLLTLLRFYIEFYSPFNIILVFFFWLHQFSWDLPTPKHFIKMCSMDNIRARRVIVLWAYSLFRTKPAALHTYKSLKSAMNHVYHMQEVQKKKKLKMAKIILFKKNSFICYSTEQGLMDWPSVINDLLESWNDYPDSLKWTYLWHSLTCTRGGWGRTTLPLFHSLEFSLIATNLYMPHCFQIYWIFSPLSFSVLLRTTYNINS